MFNKVFSENRAVYEIMWVKYGTARQAMDDIIIWHMRIACGITKAYLLTYSMGQSPS
jgi:hypothetical protein